MKPLESLERELAQLEETRVTLIASREAAAAAADAPLPRPQELEDLEIAVELGEVSPEEAGRQRAALLDGRFAGQLELERLDAALAGVERRIEVTRLRIRHAVTERRCDEAESAWLAAARRQVAVAALLGERLRSAAELVPGLQATRIARARAESERAAAYRAAGRRPLELALDEPNWVDGLDDLRALLDEGPSRPFAAAQAASASARQDWERREGEILSWFERHGCRDDLDVLPGHLRPEANRRLQQRLRADEGVRRRRQSAREARADGRRQAA